MTTLSRRSTLGLLGTAAGALALPRMVLATPIPSLAIL